MPATERTCTVCPHFVAQHVAGLGCGVGGCMCRNWEAESPAAQRPSFPPCDRCGHSSANHPKLGACTALEGGERCPCDWYGREAPPVTDDPVNHPSHYTQFGAEVIEIVEHLNFCRGNAVKYICRAGRKDPSTELQDLEKALWYLTREINRMKKEK